MRESVGLRQALGALLVCRAVLIRQRRHTGDVWLGDV